MPPRTRHAVYRRFEAGGGCSCIPLRPATLCSELGKIGPRNRLPQWIIDWQTFANNSGGGVRVRRTSPQAAGQDVLLTQVSRCAGSSLQIFALQHCLQHQRKQSLVDVNAKTCVQAVPEVHVLVRPSSRVEGFRRRHTSSLRMAVRTPAATVCLSGWCEREVYPPRSCNLQRQFAVAPGPADRTTSPRRQALPVACRRSLPLPAVPERALWDAAAVAPWPAAPPWAVAADRLR